MSDQPVFEVLELMRSEDGTMKARVRYESGLEALRAVKAVELHAEIHRASGEKEDLGLIAATYSNPATEIRSREAGVGAVNVPEGELCE